VSDLSVNQYVNFVCVCTGHTTVIYQQRPQPQTVVIRDRRSHGMGNMTTGIQCFFLTCDESVLTQRLCDFKDILRTQLSFVTKKLYAQCMKDRWQRGIVVARCLN